MKLETTLQEVEACVNSIPLTFVGDELDYGAPLTTSLFLLGRPFGHKSVIKHDNPEVGSQYIVVREELHRRLLERFWWCWTDGYIRRLSS